MERIDDLQCQGFRIIQDPDGFCFGIDAVLLAHFSLEAADTAAEIVDLCTGNGIIPLLLAAKTQAEHITGIEIQKYAAEMAVRSVQLNHIEDRVTVLCEDLRNIRDLGMDSKVNVVTVNPPYINAGLRNDQDAKLIARHEVMCTLEDVVSAAGRILKSNGHFIMVHRPARLPEIFAVMRKYKLEPKRMRLVYPYADKNANLVLIDAIKGGNPQLNVEPPLIIYREKNIFSDEITRIYAVNSEK